MSGWHYGEEELRRGLLKWFILLFWSSLAKVKCWGESTEESCNGSHLTESFCFLCLHTRWQRNDFSSASQKMLIFLPQLFQQLTITDTVLTTWAPGKAQKDSPLIDLKTSAANMGQFYPLKKTAHDNQMKNINGVNEPSCVLFPTTCINRLVNLLSCEIFMIGHPLVGRGSKKGSSWRGVKRGE